MAPLKAPGSDGTPPLFYQHFWSTVNHDITTAILSWLNPGTIPTPLNHTFITLIWKQIILNMHTNFDPLVFVMYFTKYILQSLLIN